MTQRSLHSDIRVLHVAQPLGEGVPVVVGHLVRDQAARGFDVAVACPAASATAAAASTANAQVAVWEATRSPSPASLPETRRLAAILRSLQPDILHLHSSKAGLAGRLAARNRTATIFQPHGWSFEATGGFIRRAAMAWERFAARWTTVLLCVSNGELDRGVSARIQANWRVIANGVDLDEYAPANDEDRERARKRLELGDGPLVVCVGRLTAQKGQDILVSAWPAVLRRVPSARLALVGEGPTRDGLIRQDVPNVVFAGNRTDVAEWLAAADVVAIPSRWEGMSLAMLEAMARARSIVASDVSGVRDALGDGAGAVVPTEDTDAMARALAERLRHPELAEAEGRAARVHVEERHGVAQMTEAVASLYLELVRNDSR